MYHEDPGLAAFDAAVTSSREAGDGVWDVILDRTAFYPTGGGQPHDLGRLGGHEVIEVREEGEAIVHSVRGNPGPGPVRGEVDWERRLDHRQQHTGQHILSRAFVDLCGADTVGFHLGRERCSIDLDHGDLTEADLDAAEALANRIVLDDAPVTVSLHDDPAELPDDIRREFAGTGTVRLVRIGTFDVNPCCGTHCERSGQVGPIKILRSERNKGGERVEFVCGGRALRDHARRHRLLRDLALDLTTEEDGIPARVAALRDENKAVRSRLEHVEGELRENLVRTWLDEPGVGAIVRVLGPERDAWLAPLASELAGAGRVALLAAGDDGGWRVAFAVPEGDSRHAGNLLRAALQTLGEKGGGSERLGRGRVDPAAWDRLAAALTSKEHG